MKLLLSGVAVSALLYLILQHVWTLDCISVSDSECAELPRSQAKLLASLGTVNSKHPWCCGFAMPSFPGMNNPTTE